MDAEAIPRGVKLTRNELAGYSVEWNGNFVGWIHRGISNNWTAYVRGTKPGDPDACWAATRRRRQYSGSPRKQDGAGSNEATSPAAPDRHPNTPTWGQWSTILVSFTPIHR